MKKINFPFKSLVLIAALNASTSFAQNYHSKLGCLGLDFLYSTMKMEKNFGGNVFAKSAPGIAVSFSKQFHEYFGAEVGYEMTKRKTKTSMVNAGEIIYGAAVVNTARYEIYSTYIKRTKPYLGITSKFSITNDICVQFLIGAALAKIKSYSVFVTDFDGPVVNQKDTLNKSKVVPTVKVSAEGDVVNNIGVKASVGWTNSKKIKTIRNGISRITPKDSTNIGFGLTYHL